MNKELQASAQTKNRDAQARPEPDGTKGEVVYEMTTDGEKGGQDDDGVKRKETEEKENQRHKALTSRRSAER